MRMLFYWAILALTCGYALARGRRHERIAATVCIVASLAMPFVLAPFAARYDGIEAGVAVVDIGVLVAFVLIAIDSNRFWPLWVAGLQLTSSMSHMLKAIVRPFAVGLWCRRSVLELPDPVHHRRRDLARPAPRAVADSRSLTSRRACLGPVGLA